MNRSMQRLYKAIVEAVRTEVTVGCKIAEIECLVARYCVREYPFAVDLPENTRNLCVDEDGSMLVLCRSCTFVLLYEDGTRMDGVIPALSLLKTAWIVYHAPSKTLIAMMVWNGAPKLSTVDLKTWSATLWTSELDGYFFRPRPSPLSDHVVLHKGEIAVICRPNGQVIERRPIFKHCMHVLDLGNGRLAPARADCIAVIDRNTGDDGPSRQILKPDSVSCFDPISNRFISVVLGLRSTSGLSRVDLHFQGLSDEPLRTSFVGEFDIRDSFYPEVLIVVRPDGTRLLYLRLDRRLVVYDLENIVFDQ